MSNLKTAFIVIDMINDFVSEEGALKVPQAKAIIGSIKERMSEFRKNKVPIIYVNDNHLANDIEFNKWPSHAIENTKGAKIVNELKAKKDDYIIKKRKYSAFVGTDLDLILRELKIERVILAGVVTDICVMHTAADAYMRGYKITIYKDCVAALDEKGQEWALYQMKRLYNAEII